MPLTNMKSSGWIVLDWPHVFKAHFETSHGRSEEKAASDSAGPPFLTKLYKAVLPGKVPYKYAEVPQ
jgi:hypothetical protein